MFRIVSLNKQLLTFLLLLKLKLSKPQFQHASSFMDALLMCESHKTLSKLNRLLAEATDPSALSDFFTYSPWKNDQLRRDAQAYLVDWVLQDAQSELFQRPVLISIDDSDAPKPKASKHFEPVDWHFDITQGRGYCHGAVFLTCHISYGERSTPINWRPYLREKTVRRLNRQRPPEKRLRFKSKLTLAKEMLSELAEVLPQQARIYVLYDSWYASNRLIKFCRRHGWHVICALKHNRLFFKQGAPEAKNLSRIARYTTSKRFTAVWVDAPQNSTRYWVIKLIGRLKGIGEEFAVIISKRHPGDKRPEYFLATDVTLSAKEALSLYTRRWAIEVDHLYLKNRLGLGDFRLRSVEGISKYFDLVFLTLVYLHWRKSELHDPNIKTLSDVIALHRQEQYVEFLRDFGQKVLEQNSVELAIAQFVSDEAKSELSSR